MTTYRTRIFISAILALFFLVLSFLLVSMPNGATPEYEYTIEILFRWFALPSIIISIILFLPLLNKRKIFWKKIFLFLSLAFLLIPILSPDATSITWRYGTLLSVCWLLFFASFAMYLFLQASMSSNFTANLLSLVASFFLGFASVELYILVTPQVEDGIVQDSQNSKYVSSGNVLTKFDNFRKTKLGTFPEALGYPVKVAHRESKFDQTIFDVCYTFDSLGHRVTPKDNGNPDGEILLFGCSYTFGHGLEDNQTWPWRLGQKLGANWKVTNYGVSAFGPQQMLTMLEEGMITPPTVAKRQAFFLGIEHQVRRNAGLIYLPSLRYKLSPSGEPVRDCLTSDTPYEILFTLPRYFNGSRFVYYLCKTVIKYSLMKHYQQFSAEYISILTRSAKLLSEKYQTQLIILVWPDLEFLEENIKRQGLHVIRIRDLLKNYENGQDSYYIHAKWEAHPNAMACQEIADGLAKKMQLTDLSE